MGRDAPTEPRAVASIAHTPGAAVPSLGPRGPRQGDSAPRVRTMPAQAPPLRFLSEAGPCGSWLERSRTHKGDAGWGVAPSLLPTTAGARVHTTRSAAVQRARLGRSGALPLVAVPRVAEAARRALPRARADPRRARPEATVRRTACVRRPDSREVGRAPWGPAQRRWRAAVVGPPAAPPLVWHDDVRAMHASPARRQRLAQARRGGHGPVAVSRVAAIDPFTI